MLRSPFSRISGDPAEDPVPDGVAQVVVHLLEVVHVDHDEGQGAGVAVRPADFHLQEALEVAVVVNPGERVDQGLLQGLPVQVSVLHGHRRKLAAALEDVEIGGGEGVGGGRGQVQRAQGPAVDRQGHDHLAFHVLPRRAPGEPEIRPHVVAPERPLVQDRPPEGVAYVQRDPLPLPGEEGEAPGVGEAHRQVLGALLEKGEAGLIDGDQERDLPGDCPQDAGKVLLAGEGRGDLQKGLQEIAAPRGGLPGPGRAGGEKIVIPALQLRPRRRSRRRRRPPAGIPRDR